MSTPQVFTRPLDPQGGIIGYLSESEIKAIPGIDWYETEAELPADAPVGTPFLVGPKPGPYALFIQWEGGISPTNPADLSEYVKNADLFNAPDDLPAGSTFTLLAPATGDDPAVYGWKAPEVEINPALVRTGLVEGATLPLTQERWQVLKFSTDIIREGGDWTLDPEGRYVVPETGIYSVSIDSIAESDGTISLVALRIICDGNVVAVSGPHETAGSGSTSFDLDTQVVTAVEGQKIHAEAWSSTGDVTILGNASTLSVRKIADGVGPDFGSLLDSFPLTDPSPLSNPRFRIKVTASGIEVKSPSYGSPVKAADSHSIDLGPYVGRAFTFEGNKGTLTLTNNGRADDSDTITSDVGTVYVSTTKTLLTVTHEASAGDYEIVVTLVGGPIENPSPVVATIRESSASVPLLDRGGQSYSLSKLPRGSYRVQGWTRAGSVTVGDYTLSPHRASGAGWLYYDCLLFIDHPDDGTDEILSINDSIADWRGYGLTLIRQDENTPLPVVTLRQQGWTYSRLWVWTIVDVSTGMLYNVNRPEAHEDGNRNKLRLAAFRGGSSPNAPQWEIKTDYVQAANVSGTVWESWMHVDSTLTYLAGRKASPKTPHGRRLIGQNWYPIGDGKILSYGFNLLAGSPSHEWPGQGAITLRQKTPFLSLDQADR